MTTKSTESQIHQFIKAYVESKEGQITQTNEILKIIYPDKTSPEEYTYQATLAREKKIPLIAPGSPVLQQILRECLEKGAVSQVLFSPKQDFETLIKNQFKDLPFACIDCDKVAVGEETVSICVKPQPCYHQINNTQIRSIKIAKQEPVRFLQFYFSVVFQNKLRTKNEETITILVDEKCEVVGVGDFSENNLLKNQEIKIQDFKGKFKPADFDALKKVADEKLESILKEKLALFDLPLIKEKKAKLRSFDKRLRRERREK